jgi:hypothetical protein
MASHYEADILCSNQKGCIKKMQRNWCAKRSSRLATPYTAAAQFCFASRMRQTIRSLDGILFQTGGFLASAPITT